MHSTPLTLLVQWSATSARVATDCTGPAIEPVRRIECGRMTLRSATVRTDDGGGGWVSLISHPTSQSSTAAP